MNTRHALRSGPLSLVAGLALLIMPGAALAQATEQLLQADSNGDGSVSKKELMDMRAASFDRLDRNGDGFVDGDDSPRMGPPKKKFAEAYGRAQAADANGDKRISKQELVGAPTPRFDAADTDKDGTLSSTEIAAMRASAG